MRAQKGEWEFEGTPQEIAELMSEKKAICWKEKNKTEVTKEEVELNHRKRRYIKSGKYSKKKKHHRHWSKSDLRKVKRLYKEGVRQHKIAKELGRTPHAVANKLSVMGLLGRKVKPRKRNEAMARRLRWVSNRAGELISEGMNRSDAYKKANSEYKDGRKRNGNYFRKYTDGDVDYMVREIKKGVKPNDVGKHFNITGKQVCDTVKSRTGITVSDFRKKK